jgi:putative transposase
MFSEEELRSKPVGFDRGVVTPLMASSGRRIDFSSIQKSRIEKKERSRRRWQRTLFRQQKGSQNRKKTRERLARTFEYAKNVRKDVVHKATHAVASGPDRSLFVVEDFRVRNMTSPGRYTRNGSRAKAGLNKSIRSSCWGLFVVFFPIRPGGTESSWSRSTYCSVSSCAIPRPPEEIVKIGFVFGGNHNNI